MGGFEVFEREVKIFREGLKLFRWRLKFFREALRLFPAPMVKIFFGGRVVKNFFGVDIFQEEFILFL